MLEIALFFHVLGALLFVAGIVVAGVGFEAARRRRHPGEIALLLGLTRIGVLLVLVGALAVLGFGLWLVDLAGVGYSAGWIQAALGLYVVALALGAVGGRRPKQARRLAGVLAAAGTPQTPELRALLDDRLSLITNYASAAAVLAILALMVFKPGGRRTPPRAILAFAVFKPGGRRTPPRACCAEAWRWSSGRRRRAPA